MRPFPPWSGGPRVMSGALSTRTFLVECYLPGVEAADVRAAGERALVAAAESRRDGVGVRYLAAMLMADDDVVFHVFAGPDEGAVREAAVRAQIPFERVVESVAVTTGVHAPGGWPVHDSSWSGLRRPRR